MSDIVPVARPIIGDAEIAAVSEVLRSGMLAQGREVAAFEEEFSGHFHLQRPCVAVNSGTSALHIGLLAAGVGPGDEVIVPSFTFAATANAVALTGAIPVFADIEPDTFCLDPASVAAVITERTVAIMPVHLFGQPAAMADLTALADRHGLMVFEDAAQAHGAALDGQPVGASGTVAAYSFYPTKNMTSGEGGMIACADSGLERAARLLRNQGMLTQYRNEVIGLNNRMTDIHAAIGRVQLTRVDEWTRRRRENAAVYDAELRGVLVPKVRDGAHHVYHQYTVLVPDNRDGVAQQLRERFGIGSGVFYPVPVHKLASFDVDADLPVTQSVAARCLSLPVHPGVGPVERERVVSAVNALCGGR